MDWISPVVGGALIGCAAVMLWLLLGRIAGISGIAGRALHIFKPDAPGWPLTFLLGLGIGGWTIVLLTNARPAVPADLDHWSLVVAGVLVGFGTRLGSGCTSGHGVCGISRLSKRSITATATFMAAGMTVATILHG